MTKIKVNPEGLTELDILYVDLDTLIKKVVEEEQQLDDYHSLGIRLIDPRDGYSDTFKNLSHLMYHTVLLKNPSNKDRAMRVFVDESTYDKTQTKVIDGIISALAKNSSLSVITKIERIDCMYIAIYWINNEHKKLPSNLAEARKVFETYKEHLNKSIKSSEFKQNRGASLHKGMLQILSGMLNIDESKITQDIGIILMKRERVNAYINTAKFSQEELSYSFAFYYHLFDQITSFLLDAKAYPYMIKLPGGNATLLPNHPYKGNGSMIAPAYETGVKGNQAVDYASGKILGDDEIDDMVINLYEGRKRSRKKSDIKKTKRNLLEQLESINTVPNHPIRLHLGKKAMEAWFMCMLFIAPFNDSTLATMEWSEIDEFDIEHAENKEFRTIKYRAQNKPVWFEIPTAFIKSFRQFIKLRRFILDGHNCRHLFFIGIGSDAKLGKVQQRGEYSRTIAQSFIYTIDRNLPRVTSRSARKDAGRDALNSHGLQVALSILQNEKATFLNNYNGQTAEEMALQIESFFENVDGFVNDATLGVKQESAMGECECDGDLSPTTIFDESPIEANCDDSKSCLFCIHFRTHVESEQIRKLLSVEYLITNIAYSRAEDDAHYEDAMEPWLKRINALLNAMMEKEAGAETIIKEVRTEVYEEGMLSPYWLEWVKMLEDLGRFA